MLNRNFTPLPELHTERLILRQLTNDDANEIFLLRSDEKVNEFVDRPRAKSIEDALAFINMINNSIANNETTYWAVTLKTNLKLIGTITLWNISDEDEKAEIGYELLPEFQKKGYMQEAVSKVIDFGFNAIHLKSIEAYTHPLNHNSSALLKRNRFRLKSPEKNIPESENPIEMIFYLSLEEFKK
jgi:ribosomal-protein-alanine N-acetyltransferase